MEREPFSGNIWQEDVNVLIRKNMDNLDKLFIIWAFFFQIVLIVHFAVRKPLFESYTTKFGWIVYALCIPAIVISIILFRGGN